MRELLRLSLLLVLSLAGGLALLAALTAGYLHIFMK